CARSNDGFSPAMDYW
nr:immunoglobulin heavy chain junction region [Mus musculus]